MTFGVVRRPHALAGYSHEVRIQLAVGIFVVEYRYRVRPGATPENSQDALPWEMSDLARAAALSAALGKSLAEENSAHRTWPLSLRSPTISTWIKPLCCDWARVGTAAATRSKVPANKEVSILVMVCPFALFSRHSRNYGFAISYSSRESNSRTNLAF
jgi:hypothetical protein